MKTTLNNKNSLIKKMYTNKNIIKVILLTTILILGLTSCSSYQNLSESPEVETEGIIRDENASIADTNTIANIHWKEFFKDDKLQALISEGLQQNVDMQIALTRIEQARAGLSIATGEKYPSLDVGVQVDHTRTSSGGNGTDVFGYSTHANTLGLSASWEIDLWGKLNEQARAEYANYLNSYEYKNLVQTELIASIANSYYNLLSLDEQLQISKETVIALEENAKTMAALKEAGQQNAASVSQSYALLFSTQLTVFNLETSIREQENALCVLLNRKPGEIDRTILSSQKIVKELAHGVPAQFLAKRPDVKQAELSLLAAYAYTGSAKASLYPSLTLSAKTGYAGDFKDFFNPANLAANFVAGLTQPIFYNNRLTANVEIAEAQQKEALLRFSNTVLSAGQEVSNILFNYETTFDKKELRDDQIHSLKDAVDFTKTLLVAGEANYTEVLAARRNLLAAQLSQVNDNLEQLTLTVALYKALGGGTN
ncbi:MAG: efflux transporter outer membrane subunit [Ignavibacteria bacterium]|jgi:NodT family efflux transporter outer membrane factor (OMF) lipoprotein